MPIYRIFNTNWSVKGYANPDQPGTGTLVCDSSSGGDFEKFEFNLTGYEITTIRHVSTGLYASVQNNDLVLVSEDQADPNSLNWRPVAVGPSDYDYVIWVPGQFNAWTVNGRNVILQGYQEGVVDQGFTVVPSS